MEIHPPHPIHSVREFLLELLTITIGILIALGMEGIVQWEHHRRLVHLAKDNIQVELRHNNDELLKGMQELSANERALNEALDLVHKLEQDRSTPLKNFKVNWSIEELHATSWNAASSTGALAYMHYPDVARYSRVYDLQEEFLRVQNRAFESLMGVYGLATLIDKGAKRISDSELENAERTLGLALANARTVESVGNALNQEYVNILNQR